MEQVHPRLDPRIKFSIKELLVQAMYNKINTRYNSILAKIVTANTIACKYNHNSFSYKGTFYNADLNEPRYKNQYLMKELHPEMDKLLKNKTDIELFEKPFVVAVFNRMMNTTDSIKDYYEILPESMHKVFNSIPETYVWPRKLSDEQIAKFKTEHAHWILMMKKRMVLDLVL